MTGVVVFQHVPRAVMAAPPSEVMFAPKVAVVARMDVAVGEVTVGAVMGVSSTINLSATTLQGLTAKNTPVVSAQENSTPIFDPAGTFVAESPAREIVYAV